jgi:hypothetical protein
MGWNFRRSVNLGPLRINASKSGIGYSIGGRGFRVGKDAKGRKYTAVSIPGTGIYRRDYRQSAAPQNQQAANLPNPRIPLVHGASPSTVRAGTKFRTPVWLMYFGGATLLYLVIRALS